MIPEPVILILLGILILWAFAIGGRRGSGGSNHADPEASHKKAQEMKDVAIQAVIEAEARGEIDVKTRNSQIAHLSRLPTHPQDGP